jgi:hypothetical protein
MKRARLVVLGVIIGAMLTGGVAFGVTGASTTTTYYACLAKGKLSKVGTTSPTCPSKASVISWNSVGPAGPQTGALLYQDTQYFTGPYTKDETVASFSVPAGLMCIEATATAYTSYTPPETLDLTFAPFETGPPDISLGVLANQASTHMALVPLGGSGCETVPAGTVQYVGVVGSNGNAVTDGNDYGSISVQVYSQ